MTSESGEPEIALHHVSLWLCELCLSGAGGECHVPGCAFWMNRAPDLALWAYEELTDV